MTIHLYPHDLPKEVQLGGAVAIDTETLGLNLKRDRLCLVQISSGDGTAHLVQIAQNKQPCPQLEKLLADERVEKIFHFGRFDIAMLIQHVGEVKGPIFCTKIASKLVRTYTDKHGLADLCSEILGLELSKQQQSSDWGADVLSNAQKKYAASDVLYLHRIKQRLEEMLVREGRDELARACFAFLPQRAMLDVSGFPNLDIFHH